MKSTFDGVPFPDAEIDFYTEIPNVREKCVQDTLKAKADAERDLGFEVEIQEMGHVVRDDGSHHVRIIWRRKRS